MYFTAGMNLKFFSNQSTVPWTGPWYTYLRTLCTSTALKFKNYEEKNGKMVRKKVLKNLNREVLSAVKPHHSDITLKHCEAGSVGNCRPKNKEPV